MLKSKLLFLSLFSFLFSFSQFNFSDNDNSWKNIYRGTDNIVNNLIHTKLEANFDYANSYMNGKVWLTLKPHFYSTDSLALDAKGMEIKKVSIFNNGKHSTLSYKYDGLVLRVQLNKLYKATESYIIYIEYVAKPNEFKTQGSQAITDAKGLYFINPKGEDKDKPTQIWTQGETEATSVWCPTIDRTNQKCTQEFILTVPKNYVTLSNGLLATQVLNKNGTRTDTWKMDLPNSPYLFFMGIGDFAVVKDKYKGKEVSYYVEKQYEKVARKIFGLTPEMMKYFGSITGVEYPWQKYSQIVGRDYVSGAMENTTATLHQESAQQNARELVDGNAWEETIAHELFHHWFGDLVTAESWSNLSLNESFANYSEYLWNEYKYGKDAADDHNYNDMQGYFQSNSSSKDLIRFYYADKEDMFDAVSYNKGGRILHMLRNFVGDDAFFKSLNVYLTQNKFKSAEAHQLRLAFEQVTGKDLNWFFNQWYFGSGHPKLDIKYDFDESSKTAKVILRQTQAGNKIFNLPIAIDIYESSNKTRHNIWFNSKTDTFSFSVSSKPQLINVDADKILLAEKRDNKSLENYVFQYNNARNFIDRKEALDYLSKQTDNTQAFSIIVKALKDSFYKLREKALKSLRTDLIDATTLQFVESMAKTDASRYVRAAAIDVMNRQKNKAYLSFFEKSLKDSSYTVAGAALEALLNIDNDKAVSYIPELEKDAKGRLLNSIKFVKILQKTGNDFEEVTKEFDNSSIYEKASKLKDYILYLSKVDDVANFKKGIDKIVAFRNMIAPFAPQFKESVNDNLKDLKRRRMNAKIDINAYQIDQQTSYIDEKLKDQ